MWLLAKHVWWQEGVRGHVSEGRTEGFAFGLDVVF